MSNTAEAATYKFEFEEQPERPVIAVRTVATAQELPQLMGRVFGQIMQYLGELGEYPAGPPFTAYYNMDMQHLDIEIGFRVARPLPGRGELQPGRIPGGTQAVTLHVGPYEELSTAYAALTEWVQAQGREPERVVYEFYLNDPRETPGGVPETKIMFPVKPV